MKDARFKDLLDRYINDTLSAGELRELIQYLRLDESEVHLQEMIDQALSAPLIEATEKKQLPGSFFETIIQKAALQENSGKVIAQDHDTLFKKKFFLLKRAAAIAAIFLVFFFCAYFIINRTPQKDIATAKNTSKQETKPFNDIKPGGNKAVLTLSDGSQIILDEAADGTITQQGNIKVLKLDDGRLAYNTGNSNQQEVLYNTITTPRGGQYQLVLADGSKIWLNAASSLRFPIAFTGKERHVVLTGEAYFEIAKKDNMPFTVQTNKLQVQVLGTHFNINAYDDETAVRTTLLEGAVKVIKENTSTFLKPGQQACMNKISAAVKIKDADVDEAVAWKNGLFMFNSADAASILKQIARWYDVEISYEAKMPADRFSGSISRNNNLSQVLKILETGGVHFKIDNKRIIVLPY